LLHEAGEFTEWLKAIMVRQSVLFGGDDPSCLVGCCVSIGNKGGGIIPDMLKRRFLD